LILNLMKDDHEASRQPGSPRAMEQEQDFGQPAPLQAQAHPGTRQSARIREGCAGELGLDHADHGTQ
jgi:hypothetical protein